MQRQGDPRRRPSVGFGDPSVELADWREVWGWRFPCGRETTLEGKPSASGTVTWTKLEVNVALPEGLFKRGE